MKVYITNGEGIVSTCGPKSTVFRATRRLDLDCSPPEKPRLKLSTLQEHLWTEDFRYIFFHLTHLPLFFRPILVYTRQQAWNLRFLNTNWTTLVVVDDFFECSSSQINGLVRAHLFYIFDKVCFFWDIRPYRRPLKPATRATGERHRRQVNQGIPLSCTCKRFCQNLSSTLPSHHFTGKAGSSIHGWASRKNKFSQ